MPPKPSRPEASSIFRGVRRSNAFRVDKARAWVICNERRLVQRPRGSEEGPKNPRSDRFCDFLRDYSHATSKCRHLDQELEHIIRDQDVAIGSAQPIRSAQRSEQFSSTRSARLYLISIERSVLHSLYRIITTVSDQYNQISTVLPDQLLDQLSATILAHLDPISVARLRSTQPTSDMISRSD
ncbi:hypothetical protein F511_26412 [Dorcoceras hygrometricum]|uniref:Uncharacterized protein n=1 Tax=Dorcoceras hygrometricum TaxID=472368 RepID=A0A2Z7CBS0_9LAMI|nr:hypothetical protein F511_26412 [Dorcoceras hygrometricum]